MDLHTAETTTSLRLRWRGFAITIADCDQDRRLAWRIRHDVFLDEMQGRPRADRQERDSFDDLYDHVVVTVGDTGEPVGACRLTSTRRTGRFYSAGEFDIAPFLAQPGAKVELGRVCLCPAWRNNLALAAIGRAIGHYAQACRAEWIFGCTSIASVDPAVAACLTAHFQRTGAYEGGFGVMPRAEHRIDGLAQRVAALDPARDDHAAIDALVPPLLRFYLKTGAGLGNEPALDRDFACLDFFTVVPLRHHRDTPLGRYVRC
jgi:putative hemolysin